MASVFRPTGRRIYRVKFLDQHGQEQTKSSDMMDRRAAEGLAALIERDVDRIKAGLQPERPDITGQFLGLDAIAPQFLPLDQIIGQYLADIARQGMSEATVRHRRYKLRLMARRGPWRTLRDITANRITSALAAMAERGLAVHSTNAYRDTLNAFLEWCVSQNLTDANAGRKVKPARGGAIRPRRRRAFTADELRRFVAAAPRRADFYLSAALTGLRLHELSLVERRDFDLDKQVWTCRAEVDKMNKAHRLPILPDLIPKLRQVCAHKSPAAKLFGRRIGNGTFDMDLRRAGVPKIAEDGRRLNFHSLRYTFCTLLAGKLPLKSVQRLMRHASLKQTTDLYLQLDLDSLIDQVIDLPSLFSLEGNEPPAGQGVA